MRPIVLDRSTLSVLFVIATWQCQAQSRATCLYSETFPSGSLPTDWAGLPSQVERLDADGNGTGEFTAPWQVGSTYQANAGGYFPVPDEPVGNTFAMANDDAPPCDCAMTDLSLFSPFIDLSATTAPAVTYRIYHDGRPFNGQASLWACPDGGTCTRVDDVPAVLGQWQQRTVDLSAFTGGELQLRFRYDDGGQWASGVAVDDICVFERLGNDIALSAAWLGDATASALNSTVRSLGYSRMPIEQQTSLRLSARLRNNGTSTASALRVEAAISLNGQTPTVITTTVVESLAPLHDTLVTWDTGFLAGGPGNVTIALTAEALSADEDTSDNSASLGYVSTSAEEGNDAMALDNDLASSVCGTDSGFSAGCRFEMIGVGSVVHGISVRFGAGTLLGSRVHALLADGTLNLLSSSASHTVSDGDLALSFSGGSVYIPLDSAVTISAAGDVIALVRCLPDSGALRVTCGGAVPQGAALLIDVSDFLISYPGTAPIVRLHLTDPVTGLPGSRPRAAKLTISPNPAKGSVSIGGLPARTEGTVEIRDLQGRPVMRVTWQQGQGQLMIGVLHLPPGCYQVLAWPIDPSGGQLQPRWGSLLVE